MRTLTFLVLLTMAAGCKNYYRFSASNMEGTIPTGSRRVVERVTSYHQNDIAAFRATIAIADPSQAGSNRKVTYVSRIIAGPGDSLNILAGYVFLNGIKLEETPLMKHAWEITSPNRMVNDSLQVRDEDWIFVQNPQKDGLYHFIALLTNLKANELLKQNKKSISLQPNPDSLDNEFIVRPTEAGRWSPDFYGPLRIPLPGDSVFINDVNRGFYKLAPGYHSGWNIVREKLYFLLGDNRNASNDSRYYGLVPESAMIGIVK